MSILKATKTAGCETSLFCRYIFMNYSTQTSTDEYICVQKRTTHNKGWKIMQKIPNSISIFIHGFRAKTDINFINYQTFNQTQFNGVI